MAAQFWDWQECSLIKGIGRPVAYTFVLLALPESYLLNRGIGIGSTRCRAPCEVGVSLEDKEKSTPLDSHGGTLPLVGWHPVGGGRSAWYGCAATLGYLALII